MQSYTEKLVLVENLPKVIEVLQMAARRLRLNGVDQWRYWLDPPTYKLKWLKEGVENQEYFFISIDETLTAMYRKSSQDLAYWGEQAETAWYIHSLVVLDHAVNREIGKYILLTIEKDALKNGVKVLRLDCHAGNEKLCRYYESIDFVKVGEKQMPHSLNNLYEKRL